MDIFGFLKDIAVEFGILNAVALAAVGYYIHTTNRGNKAVVNSLQKIVDSQAEQISNSQDKYHEIALTVRQLLSDSVRHTDKLTSMINNQDSELKHVQGDLKTIIQHVGQNKVAIGNINNKLHELAGSITGTNNIINQLLERTREGGR